MSRSMGSSRESSDGAPLWKLDGDAVWDAPAKVSELSHLCSDKLKLPPAPLQDDASSSDTLNDCADPHVQLPAS